MTFKVTMTVPENQLGALLSNFSKAQLVGIEIAPFNKEPAAPQPPKTSGGKKPANPKLTGTPTSRICLGDSSHQVKGEVSIAIVKLLEEMEAQRGIGNITRRILATEAKARGISIHTNEPIMAMLKAGQMVIVGED